MSFKNLNQIVFNGIGLSDWLPNEIKRFEAICRAFPNIEVGKLKSETWPILNIDNSRVEFKDVNEFLNWSLTHKRLSVCFTLVQEPRVSSIPSLCLLWVTEESPARFRSFYEPNQWSTSGQEFLDTCRRQSYFLTNSKSLSDLVCEAAGRSIQDIKVDSTWIPSQELLLSFLDHSPQNSPSSSNAFYPQVFVVTPSFNQGRFIEETIQSVLNQDYPNFKYFVADGVSQDETLSIIKKYEGRLSWISEKDSGYPEAVNKIMNNQACDYLIWLASDDCFSSNQSLSRLVQAAVKSKADVVYGDAFYVDEVGQILGSYNTDEYSMGRLQDWCLICQPSTLFSYKLFSQIGGLDTSLRCVADYDLWLRLSDLGAKFHRIGGALSKYRLHSLSLTLTQKKTSYIEIFDLQLSRYSRVGKNWVVGALKEVILMQKLNLAWKVSSGQALAPNLLNIASPRRKIRIFFEKYLADSLWVQRLIRWGIR